MESDSPDQTGAVESYSSEKVLIAVTEVTSPTVGHEDVTTKCVECARMGFLKYVVEHRRGVGSEVKGCVNARLLQLSPRKSRERNGSNWDKKCWSSKVSAGHDEYGSGGTFITKERSSGTR